MRLSNLFVFLVNLETKEHIMHYSWTVNEMDYLVDNFGKLSDEEIALTLNKTTRAVLSKASRMSLTKDARNSWNKDEIKILVKNFHLSTEELVKLLPRHTALSIDAKGYNLGLFKHRENGKLTRGRESYRYRRAAEAKLGRKLKKGECVHHIDCDRSNNDHSNLHIFANGSDHARSHGSLNRLIKPLIEKGIIRFDAEIGSYFLSGE
jgi:hypothetical protein